MQFREFSNSRRKTLKIDSGLLVFWFSGFWSSLYGFLGVVVGTIPTFIIYFIIVLKGDLPWEEL